MHVVRRPKFSELAALLAEKLPAGDPRRHGDGGGGGGGYLEITGDTGQMSVTLDRHEYVAETDVDAPAAALPGLDAAGYVTDSAAALPGLDAAAAEGHATYHLASAVAPLHHLAAAASPGRHDDRVAHPQHEITMPAPDGSSGYAVFDRNVVLAAEAQFHSSSRQAEPARLAGQAPLGRNETAAGAPPGPNGPGNSASEETGDICLASAAGYVTDSAAALPGLDAAGYVTDSSSALPVTVVPAAAPGTGVSAGAQSGANPIELVASLPGGRLRSGSVYAGFEESDQLDLARL